jgi:hypothetical protein
MTKKLPTNGVTATGAATEFVTLTRSEHNAFLAREETFARLDMESRELAAGHIELMSVCDSQAKTIGVTNLKITYLESIIGFQNVLIEHLRDGTKVASLEDLTAFWKKFYAFTDEGMKNNMLKREVVDAVRPDIFKAWQNWIHTNGKVDPLFGALAPPQTREEYEVAMPKTRKEMAEHTIRRLNEENATLAARVHKLEAEASQIVKQKTEKTATEKTP